MFCDKCFADIIALPDIEQSLLMVGPHIKILVYSDMVKLHYVR